MSVVTSRNNTYTPFLQGASGSTLNRVDQSAKWISESPSTKATIKIASGVLGGFIGGYLGSWLGSIIGALMQSPSSWDDHIQYNYAIAGYYYGLILGAQVGGGIALSLGTELIDFTVSDLQRKCAEQWMEDALYKGYFRQDSPVNAKLGTLVEYVPKKRNPDPKEYYQNRQCQHVLPRADTFLSLGLTCSPCDTYAVLYDPATRFIYIDNKENQTTRYWDPNGEKVYATEKVGEIRKAYLNRLLPDVTGKDTPYTESLHFNPATLQQIKSTQVLDKKIISNLISAKNMGFSSGKTLCFMDDDSGVQIVVDMAGVVPKTIVYCDVGRRLFLHENQTLREVLAESVEYKQEVQRYFSPIT